MDLKTLIQHYPLPEGWTLSEPFVDVIEISSIKLQLLGLVAESANFGPVTASAVCRQQVPWVRAYFELLERVSILLAREKLPQIFNPTSPDQKWVYSKSNGVAAHTDSEQAKRASFFELVERDRVLRSWYGQIRPIPVEFPEPPLAEALSAYYRFEAYDFGEGVGGVFGFPLAKQHPLVHGFGSRASLKEGLAHAVQETLQRLGFLWGEEVLVGQLEFSPTPDFHLEYFLSEEGAQRIRNWLDGKHLGRFQLQDIADPNSENIQYLDLTPLSLQEKVHIYQASAPSRIPLTFGLGNPCIELRSQSPAELESFLIHPVA